MKYISWDASVKHVSECTDVTSIMKIGLIEIIHKLKGDDDHEDQQVRYNIRIQNITAHVRSLLIFLFYT